MADAVELSRNAFKSNHGDTPKQSKSNIIVMICDRDGQRRDGSGLEAPEPPPAWIIRATRREAERNASVALKFKTHVGEWNRQARATGFDVCFLQRPHIEEVSCRNATGRAIRASYSLRQKYLAAISATFTGLLCRFSTSTPISGVLATAKTIAPRV